MTKPVLLRCAPNGARSGFLQVRVAGTTTSITVLPKVWRDAQEPRTLSAKAGTWIVAHELDLLVFPPESAATADAFAEAAARAAVDEAQRDAALGTPAAPAPLEADDEGPQHDEGPENAQAHSRKRDIEPIVRRIYGVKSVPTPPHAATEGSTESATSSLMALAMLCERLRDRSAGAALDHIHADSGDGAPSAMSSGTHDNPVLALLRAWQFVEFVKARVRQIRQGYREEEDWLWTPRGRLLTAGLVRMEASDEPRALCRYDAFTPSTALFRLIVTALEHLAGAGAAQGVLADTERAWHIRQEASRLRHGLAFIPSAPPAQAVSEMRHARLGRLLRAWDPARVQAIDILERRSPDMVHKVGEADATLVWSVDTSKVWERLLADAVRARAERVAVPGSTDGLKVSCPTPWQGIGTSKSPDMATMVDGVGWVLDAKYKAPEWTDKGSPVIGQGDQYQLFAYSHLASVDGAPVARLAILRPRPAAGRTPGPKSYTREGAPSGAAQPTLTVADLPFPDRDAILDDARYEKERNALKTALAAVLGA